MDYKNEKIIRLWERYMTLSTIIKKLEKESISCLDELRKELKEKED